MKTAETTYPVHTLIAARWSPRAFADRPVEPEKLGSLFEAARWAPSCYNAQPWSFVVATRDDSEAHACFSSLLLEGNAWARRAPVLLLSVAKLDFDHDGAPNRHAWHDTGLAVENLVLQAEALGLATHQMAGFDALRARDLLGIPARHEPVAMIAVGYRGEADVLAAALREREGAKRARKELRAFVFGGQWGRPVCNPSA